MTVFQPIVPNPAWPKSFTFSPALRAGNLVFLSGTTATDDKGRIVGAGDIAAQTRQIFAKFAAILESVGGQSRQHCRDHGLRSLARRLRQDC